MLNMYSRILQSSRKKSNDGNKKNTHFSERGFRRDDKVKTFNFKPHTFVQRWSYLAEDQKITDIIHKE